MLNAGRLTVKLRSDGHHLRENGKLAGMLSIKDVTDIAPICEINTDCQRRAINAYGDDYQIIGARANTYITDILCWRIRSDVVAVHPQCVWASAWLRITVCTS